MTPAHDVDKPVERNKIVKCGAEHGNHSPDKLPLERKATTQSNNQCKLMQFVTLKH
jgi:hypothetical protein